MAQVETEVDIKPKHTFKIYKQDHSLTKEMQTSIETTINRITKHENVVPLDEFEDVFIVRMDTNSKQLREEYENDIITHIAHVTLVCEDPEKKKIIMGVWRRLKASKVLR